MTRALLTLLLCSAVAGAHGGAFRPPPGGGGGDPGGGPGGAIPTTGGGSGGGGGSQWTSWWAIHAERYLRLRERLLHREVITGPEQRTDLFDRDRARRELTPVMLEALRDEDDEVRTAAAVALGKFGAKQAVPQLLETFRNDRVKQVREAAMLGLMLMRDPILLDELRGVALNAANTRRMRGFAVLGLGFLKDTEFLARVMLGKEVKLKGSRTAVEELQACAALALGNCDDAAALTPLLTAVRSRTLHKNVSGYAASSLGRLGNPIALPDVVSLLMSDATPPYVRYGAAVAAGGLVKPKDRGIVNKIGRKALRDRDGGIRSLLIMSLGRIGGDDAASHLAGGLKVRDQRLRGFLFLALALTGHKDAGPLLHETFPKLKHTVDRTACALALGLCGHKPAAKLLRAEVKQGNLNFAPFGLLALGLLDDPKAIPLVEKALAKHDPLLRRQAALALALLRRSASVPQLVKLLNGSKSLFMRGSAVAALGMVGNDKAIGPLLEVYHDKSRQGVERALALAALGRIGDPERIPLLTQIAFDINPYPTIDAIREALRIL